VPDWLEFMLLAFAWAPISVLLHELGHAVAALVLTDGEVSIGMGPFGGWATYEPERLRRSRDLAWIAAAGPAVSLAIAIVLWSTWLKAGPDYSVTIVWVGAWVATGHFLASALPVVYGAGFAMAAESDGRVIWRVLTGAPPGGIERELRRLTEPQRAIQPVYLVPLVLAAVLGILVDPMTVVGLAIIFGLATLLQRAPR
jgi:hypothetical protein